MGGVLFLTVFLVGYGSGNHWKGGKTAKTNTSLKQDNYSTGKAVKAVQAEPVSAEAKPEVLEVPAATTSAAVAAKETVAGAAITNPNSACKIKGNISSKSKIYHVPGGAFYDRVKPEQCFNTEAEAIQAGYRKSSR